MVLLICAVTVRSYGQTTGSMAPTLLGDHFDARCATCGYVFSVAKREGEIPSTGEHVEFRCPLCGTEAPENAAFLPGDVRGGAHFLVSIRDRKPARWDVIVFKYPKDPSKDFVKRVVGLPGETIRFDARGDVWVKAPGAATFAIARKPPPVQRALWFPAWDSHHLDPRVGPNLKDGVIELPAVAGGEDLWFDVNGQFRDHVGYNPATTHGSAGRNFVGDLRVSASVTPGKGTKSVRLAIVENTRTCMAEIPVDSGDSAILTDAATVTSSAKVQAPCTPIPSGSPSRVSLAYADERLTLEVNDKTILERDDPAAFAQTTSSGVRLGCVGPGGARFEDVKIDRDIYFSGMGSFDPAASDVAIPADSYFVVGDNCPNSMDSRVFGFVPSENLLGRVFLEYGARMGWVH
jgi:signal peptidase I